MRGRRLRILHLITRLELGGAQQNTLFCTENHDRGLFEVSLISGRGGVLDAEALQLNDASVSLLPWLRRAISPLYDLLAFCQSLEAITSDSTEVSKNIGAAILSDEAVAFRFVKPLNRSGYCRHILIPDFIEVYPRTSGAVELKVVLVLM